MEVVLCTKRGSTQQDLYTMTLGRQAGSKRGGIGGMVEDVLEADLEDRG